MSFQQLPCLYATGRYAEHQIVYADKSTVLIGTIFSSVLIDDNYSLLAAGHEAFVMYAGYGKPGIQSAHQATDTQQPSLNICEFCRRIGLVLPNKSDRKCSVVLSGRKDKKKSEQDKPCLTLGRILSLHQLVTKGPLLVVNLH